MAAAPQFEFHVEADADLGDTLVVGFASPAMASLIAADHLATDGETTQVGHVTSHNLPTITPFSEGTPRYPIRLYTTGAGPTILVSELFVPLEIGDRFADATVELTADHGIDTVTVLYGVPYPHGPDEHAVFSVTTGTYPRATLDEAGIEPLRGGFLDGTPGTLLNFGIEDETPAVGVFVTPAHPPGPDFEAALRLLDAVEHQFELTLDTTALQAQSEEIHRYYEELAARIESESEKREFPEDRMYM